MTTWRSSELVEPGRGEPLPTPWGEVVGKVTGAHSSGAFALTELTVAADWRGPGYVHHEVDECFYVVAGTFLAAVDDHEDVLRLDPGALLYVPRGVARSLFSAGDGGRLLVIRTPGNANDPKLPLSGIELHEPPFRLQLEEGSPCR